MLCSRAFFFVCGVAGSRLTMQLPYPSSMQHHSRSTARSGFVISVNLVVSVNRSILFICLAVHIGIGSLLLRPHDVYIALILLYSQLFFCAICSSRPAAENIGENWSKLRKHALRAPELEDTWPEALNTRTGPAGSMWRSFSPAFCCWSHAITCACQ